MLIGIFMIIAALLFKVGAVPFHFWNPDVYQGSPKPVMAYMSTVVKIAGFIAFFKLIRGTFGTISDQWMYFMYVVIIDS
jgi:NADH-quinone oxidoreductase subunit N